ncbi:MAG: phosphoribosylanthranilate isomerase [Armatimonadota bacterium]|nr:phosphoribosylanthranilate isomerase [bacterium]
MTLTKICGVTNIDDALAAVDLGADYIGFVFAESPRRVDTRTAGEVIRALGGRVKTVGVFVDESDDVLRMMDECGFDYAQLHGNQSEDFAGKIGGERVIRVARVSDESSVDVLPTYTEAAYYLLDTYKKGQAGGTGEVFNWTLAVRAKSLGKPVFLSGGLTPQNIIDAINTVKPYAVDISSGVEMCPGKKDHHKIKELIDNVRAADIAS